jgi:glycosyltransferase involved in cell wall biosynthesis
MISVICSVYNSSEYLDNYLSYVNNQLLREFEIIFVDAKSTDDSLKKIEEFQFREGISVQILRLEERVPIYEAWNKAILVSSHDYVINFNTDDKLFRTALISYATYAHAAPHIDVFYTAPFISIDANHSQITTWFNYSDANIKENMLAGCHVGPFPLLKKQSIIYAGLFNPSFTISGDYEMWCRLRHYGYTFMKLEESLGVYFQNPKGVSTEPTEERFNENVRQDNLIRDLYK